MLPFLLSLQLISGLYIQAGGLGELELSEVAGGRQFKIDTVGANGHSCTASGPLAAGDVIYIKKFSADTPACTLTFTPKEGGIEVVLTPLSDCHSQYCGVRASIDGLFLTAPKLCATKAATKRRAEGQALYGKKQWEAAVQVWQGLFDQCAPFLFWSTVDWLRNDLALGYHKLDRNEACLKSLEPLAELRAMKPADLDEFPPADAEVKKKLAKATKVNFKLCSAAKSTKKPK